MKLDRGNRLVGHAHTVDSRSADRIGSKCRLQTDGDAKPPRSCARGARRGDGLPASARPGSVRRRDAGDTAASNLIGIRRRRDTGDENHCARGTLHHAAGRAEPSARRTSRQRPREAARLRCRGRAAQPRRRASSPPWMPPASTCRCSRTTSPVVRRSTPTRRSRWRGRSTICLFETIKAHPDRFAGLAALPTADPAAAVKELDRAVTRLGFKGAMINGHTRRQRFIDDKKFWRDLRVRAGAAACRSTCTRASRIPP